ncbi:hypothetical protein D8770_26685 [Methylobacterium sp. DB1607]|nr:hypothetical protein [Methylobacterium sp. DB1607]
MTCAGCVRAIEQAIRRQVMSNPAVVEVDIVERRGARVAKDADPQIVSFDIQNPDYEVEAVR